MGGSQQLFPYIYTDLVEEILNNLRSEWRSRIETVLDVGYIIIQDCIGFLFNQRARYNVCFRFLNIYDQQLSEVAASEADWFKQLSNQVAALPNPSDVGRYEIKAQDCLQSLLDLDKITNIMAKINKLKQIRRDLNVLLEVVATQVKVVKQMTDELEATEEFDWNEFTNSPRLMIRRQRRAKKLEARSQSLHNLDIKAESIIHNLELFITRKEQQVQNLQSYFSSRLAERSSRMEVIILVLTIVTTFFVSRGHLHHDRYTIILIITTTGPSQSNHSLPSTANNRVPARHNRGKCLNVPLIRQQVGVRRRTGHRHLNSRPRHHQSIRLSQTYATPKQTTAQRESTSANGTSHR